MLIIEAGAERTPTADRETGKPIFITTTARKAFRNAFPTAKKVRNNILNIAIATLFSTAKTSGTFKPKSTGAGDHSSIMQSSGIVRAVGGGRFIALSEGSWIKIIDFKGSPPSLDLPSVPTPSNLNGAPPPSTVVPFPETTQLSNALTGK